MSATDGLRVQRLSADLVDSTAHLLARAMEIDPAYAYMFVTARERARGLPDFFARNLRTHLPHGCTQVALDRAGGVIATLTLRPPGGVPISTLTLLRRGLLPFFLAHGREPVARLLWLKDTYDRLEAAAAQGKPHHHVHMMAVDPPLQGTGIGSWLLRQALAQRPPARAELATVLTTHLPRNVVFYRRAGFQVVAECSLQPPRGSAYRVWSMSG